MGISNNRIAQVTEQRKLVFDYFTEATEKLQPVSASGDEDWSSCWRPRTLKMGEPITGGNALALMCIGAHKGFTDPRWVSHLEAKQMKHKFLAGTHSCLLEFWRGASFGSSSAVQGSEPYFNVQQLVHPPALPEERVTTAEDIRRTARGIMSKKDTAAVEAPGEAHVEPNGTVVVPSADDLLMEVLERGTFDIEAAEAEAARTQTFLLWKYIYLASARVQDRRPRGDGEEALKQFKRHEALAAELAACFAAASARALCTKDPVFVESRKRQIELAREMNDPDELYWCAQEAWNTLKDLRFGAEQNASRRGRARMGAQAQKPKDDMEKRREERAAALADEDPDRKAFAASQKRTYSFDDLMNQARANSAALSKAR